MDKTLLIQALIQQTMVLAAHLATARGRASLASVENIAFASLVQALREQGLSNKVIADMMGMPLSTFLQKNRRLTHTLKTSKLEEGPQTGWEQVFQFIRIHGTVSRKEVQLQFYMVDEKILASILNDMVERGWVYVGGPRDNQVFIVSPNANLDSAKPQLAINTLVRVMIFRSSPVTFNELSESLGLSDELLKDTLEELTSNGLIHAEERAQTVYTCERFFVDSEDVEGWEAAVFDHYQAMVDALCKRLENKVVKGVPDRAIGGSTYTFGVWPDHPLEERVEGFLTEVRELATALRKDLQDYDETQGEDNLNRSRTFTFYCGQTVRLFGEGE